MNAMQQRRRTSGRTRSAGSSERSARRVSLAIMGAWSKPLITMTRLRLLADDLTGALDSAARFVPLTGPVAVTRDNVAAAGPAAIDSGTRDLAADAPANWSGARTSAGRRRASIQEDRQPVARPRGAGTRRVHAPVRSLRAGAGLPVPGPDHSQRQAACAQRRWLARHRRRSGGGAARAWRRGDMRDAETDADLDAIVAEGRRLPGRVLWCGTGGLAGALAGRGRCRAGSAAAGPGADRQRPSGEPRAGRRGPADLRRRSSSATCRPEPIGTKRARTSARHSHALLQRVERPGTLFVTGGQTLRDLCDALGVTWLEVDGEIEPGVPTSLMRGGPWDGQRLVSKSGAFGDTGFLAALLGEAR